MFVINIPLTLAKIFPRITQTHTCINVPFYHSAHNCKNVPYYKQLTTLKMFPTVTPFTPVKMSPRQTHTKNVPSTNSS